MAFVCASPERLFRRDGRAIESEAVAGTRPRGASEADDDELRDIPVIAVTAFAMKGDEERIRQGGCEAYISKPISIGTFLETVRRYLGEA